VTDVQRLVFSFFNAEVMRRYLPAIVDGFLLTVWLAVAVIVTGLAVGLALALVRAAQVRLVNWAIVLFVDVLRAVPPLVVIVLLYFAFPYVHVRMSGVTATWLSLSLVLAAFAEEIFWAGILAVPRGQWEAARSTGLTFAQTLAHVVLPHALRLTIPPLTNRAIAITKGTALGSVVGVPEILTQAITGQSFAGNASPLTLGAAAYLVLFVPFVVLGRWVETRFSWKR
jgi:polar amino acid transport system permease protein